MNVGTIKLTKINVLSAAKMYAAMGAAVGFAVGLVWAFFAIFFGGMMGAAGGNAGLGAGLGAIFGIGAVIAIPIIYGLAGFVAGALGAFVYNLLARVVGGVELQYEKV